MNERMLKILISLFSIVGVSTVLLLLVIVLLDAQSTRDIAGSPAGGIGLPALSASMLSN
ncbi:MAG: hypothetical protein V3V05_12215 [Pontiella sp.]